MRATPASTIGADSFLGLLARELHAKAEYAVAEQEGRRDRAARALACREPP